MAGFGEAMRRVITGDGADGASLVILDGGPSSASGAPDLGGLFEIWEDVASGRLDARDQTDLGPARPVLRPRPGAVQVRWFVSPAPAEGVSREALNAQTRARFAEFDGDHHLTDQSRHPAMHRTSTLDVICLLQGEASLILDNGEIRLKPGQVVIQRGTAHAWQAHGGPALFLAVLIDRELVGDQ